MHKTISITGISAVSGLGTTLSAHADAMENGRTGLRQLKELLGNRIDCDDLQASWIQDRSILNSRKWAPASALAVYCARQAIADAGLEGSDLKNAAVIAGSSRGNAWLSDWPDRRPFKLMAASNSMHGEIASAVSIEFGITGPWQTISSGCAASLDAIGMAWMMLQTGVVRHAIVLGIELPLVPEIVADYIDTGVLSTNGINDPYHPNTSGFFPGEAGCALVLSAEDIPTAPKLDGYWCNSDADSPIGMPADGKGLRACLESALTDLPANTEISAVCPHASGTHLHSLAEERALLDALKPSSSISLHPLKPFTGHTVGASGALDTAILVHYLRNKELPPNLPLTQPPSPFTLPTKKTKVTGSILKIAVGMGGHNSIIALRPPISEKKIISLEISISNQNIRVLKNGTEQHSYPISSAKNGLGSEEGSLKTPLGNFIIAEKHGHDSPIYTIFKGLAPVGQWSTGEHTDDDLITSRILWLEGQDADNANTKSRYIYIHGTNHEDEIGTPQSCGCIRMRNQDIIELFDTIKENTTVRIRR